MKKHARLLHRTLDKLVDARRTGRAAITIPPDERENLIGLLCSELNWLLPEDIEKFNRIRGTDGQNPTHH
jgi:hypothetical protein